MPATADAINNAAASTCVPLPTSRKLPIVVRSSFESEIILTHRKDDVIVRKDLDPSRYLEQEMFWIFQGLDCRSCKDIPYKISYLHIEKSPCSQITNTHPLLYTSCRSCSHCHTFQSTRRNEVQGLSVHQPHKDNADCQLEFWVWKSNGPMRFMNNSLKADWTSGGMWQQAMSLVKMGKTEFRCRRNESSDRLWRECNTATTCCARAKASSFTEAKRGIKSSLSVIVSAFTVLSMACVSMKQFTTRPSQFSCNSLFFFAC